MQLNNTIPASRNGSRLEPKQLAIVFTALAMFLQRNREELAAHTAKSDMSSVLAGKVKQMYLWLIEETDALMDKMAGEYGHDVLELEKYLQEGLNRK